MCVHVHFIAQVAQLINNLTIETNIYIYIKRSTVSKQIEMLIFMPKGKPNNNTQNTKFRYFSRISRLSLQIQTTTQQQQQN